MMKRFVLPPVPNWSPRFEIAADFGLRTGSLYALKNNALWKDNVVLINEISIPSPILSVNDEETLLVFYNGEKPEKKYIYDLEHSVFHKTTANGALHGFLDGKYPVFDDSYHGRVIIICVVTIDTVHMCRIDVNEYLFFRLENVYRDIPFFMISTPTSQVLYRFDPTDYPSVSVQSKFDFRDYRSFVYIGSGLLKCRSSQNEWFLYDILNSSLKKEGSVPVCPRLSDVPDSPDYVQNGVDISIRDITCIDMNRYSSDFPKCYFDTIEAIRDFFYKEYYLNAIAATKGLRSRKQYDFYFEKKENDDFHYIQVVYRHNVGQNIQVFNNDSQSSLVDILNDGTMYDRGKSNKLIGKIAATHRIPRGPDNNRKYAFLLETTVDASARTYKIVEIITKTAENTAKIDKALDSVVHIHNQMKFDTLQLIAHREGVFGMMLPKTTINLIGYYLSLIKRG